MTEVPDVTLTGCVKVLRALAGPDCSCRVCIDARALARDLSRRLETQHD